MDQPEDGRPEEAGRLSDNSRDRVFEFACKECYDNTSIPETWQTSAAHSYMHSCLRLPTVLPTAT